MSCVLLVLSRVHALLISLVRALVLLRAFSPALLPAHSAARALSLFLSLSPTPASALSPTPAPAPVLALAQSLALFPPLSRALARSLRVLVEMLKSQLYSRFIS